MDPLFGTQNAAHDLGKVGRHLIENAMDVALGLGLEEPVFG